jgi:cell division transport system permease protein
MPRLVLGATFRQLRRAGAAGLAGFLVTALAALTAGATLVGLDALGRRVAAWRAEIRIVAVIGEPTGRADGARVLLPAARKLPGVATVRHVTTAEALADMRRFLGPAAEGLDRLAVNPLPARLEVTPAAGADGAALRALVDRLGQLPGVTEVQAAIGWVEPAERLAAGLRWGGLALAGLLGLGALAALAAAVRLGRLRSADESAILRLAGATDGSLRAPLFLQAAVLSTLGAALGVAALRLGAEGGAPAVTGWLAATFGLVALPGPGWPVALALIGGGTAMGLVAGLAGSWGAR